MARAGHRCLRLTTMASLCCLCATGQVSARQTRVEAKGDLGLPLLEPVVWQTARLPAAWREVSARSKLGIRELRTAQPVFGHVPQNVQAFLRGNQLERIVVTYLDAGFFFANREAKAREFRQTFRVLEKALPKRLAKETRTRGKGSRQGRGEMRTRTTEYTHGDLSLRLLCEDGFLISLTIQPKANADRDWLAGPLPARDARRKLLAANVRRQPNGDVVIQGVPMNDQHERGYCAIASLAMVMQYHGLAVDVDLLAAKAGYRGGKVARANWEDLFRAIGREAKLRLTDSNRYRLRQIKKAIDRGEPVLVGRAFSRERDARHRAFAARYAHDPDATLPDPRSKAGRQDRRQWPTLRDGPGHMSVITGYNDKRQEILFTESWGEHYRQRRMRTEEMEKTAHALFFFGL
ncbi:MAG: hypothetical protein HN849_29885 [Victivallales bacterium]|nr:hypothetical protein [Victivallales bacterium]